MPVTESSTKPRILVVGAGGIGGTTAAHLARAGHDVSVLTTNRVIADVLRSAGFKVRGEQSEWSGPARAVFETLDPRSAAFDFALLATQPTEVEVATQSVQDVLKPDARVVCFQNGLCEERVARLVGRERVVGAVVGWGASMPEPGVYDRTSRGGFSLGTLEGAQDARLVQLAGLLEAVAPVNVTQNLAGIRWSKLAINCAISTLGTIGGRRLGELLRHRFVRRLALEIMTEVHAVATREGVKLEKVAGTFELSQVALSASEIRGSRTPSLVAKHALLLAVGARFRRLRSSMLSAIERGRTPSVDFLNGEVIQRAERHGISTPINAAARASVWEIAKKSAQPSLVTLRKLYEHTR
jgi:2-dehydropantoate 2-reductase